MNMIGTVVRIAALAGIFMLNGGSVGQAAAPPLPKTPQTISIIDVGGVLALTQAAIENYRKAHPELVAKFNFTKAPGPELPGKLKAQQDAGRVDIDLVLSGIDGIS